MEEMPPVHEDAGLAGLRVAEHLEALTVACEGTCPPGQKAEEGAPWLPEGGSAVSPAEGLPGASEPALLGSEDAGQGDTAMEEEPPPVDGGGGSFSHRCGTSPNSNFGAGGYAAPGASEGSPGKPSSGGEAPEDLPPAPAFPSGSSPPLGLDRDPTKRDLAGESAPPAKASLSGLPAVELVKGSSGTSSESDSESESDTDTDSSSSVSSSSSSCLPSLSEDDEQQCKNEKNSCITRKKGELTEKELPNIEELSIILPESVELLPFGKVSSIIEHQVIIESEKGIPPVNEDTVFFKGDHHSIGKVFEVFGPVSHPFYILQFKSPEHIESRGIKVHDAVYFAPSVESFTQYIFPEKLKQERGSDASWKNDEEPPPEALDFSDDEKERAAKQQKKAENVRRKKFKQNYSENEYNCQPRQQHPSDYFGGYCRGEPNPRFSRGRFPQSSAPPRFFRQPPRTPQPYCDYAEPNKPSSFYQQQRPDNLWRHPYAFPPPMFETANHEANFPPPPPPVTWGWPHGSSQNIHDPLLSLLSLPPPPPPPLPPPSATSKSGNPS